MNRAALKWGLVALAVLLLGAALGRAWLARRAPPAEAPKAVVIELAPADVTVAATRELTRRLEITGALKAVDTAVVKAKVAGELQTLTVREGDTVAAGQELGRIDATEYGWRLRQAQEQAGQARAQLEIAERALENNRALVDQGFISKNALDTSVSNAAAARAGLQAAQAAAELARKAQNDTVLRAPIGGQVAQRMVQPGERVPVDARLLEIVDLSRLELEAAIAAEDVGAVRVGAAARLQVDGVAEPVIARVARINPAAQAGSRAVTVYLAVDGAPALRQGLFATGRIELERRRVLAVPESAVRLEGARPRVLAVEDGRVVAHTVSLGLRGAAADGSTAEPMVEIAAGLAEGGVLLRASAGALREGSLVRLPARAASVATSTPADGAAAR